MDENTKLIIEKRNSELFLRPRFSIELNELNTVIVNKFNKSFLSDSIKFSGKTTDNHVFISVSKKDEHFWSPQLQLEILYINDKTTEIKGLFGPKPQVWTLFMFIHFVIGFMFLFFAVLLYSRLSLKESIFLPITMLIALPLVWVLLYFLGKMGKDSGKKQMQQLHDFMIGVLYKNY